MKAYGPDWTQIETPCIMPSSAPSAYFGGNNVADTARARSLALHLATVGSTALVHGKPAEKFTTRWLGATYADGSVGGVWITERADG